MPRIHVCPLSKIEETVATTGARHMVTLINPDYPVSRPQQIASDRHLYLGMADITEPSDGQVLPAETHVRELLAFARKWDRAQPLLIHCFLGISRSTAAAFISACALRPGWAETDIATLIRERSPTAMPNAKLVEIGDRLLGRNGRMSAAAASIAQGEMCVEGTPFHIEID